MTFGYIALLLAAVLGFVAREIGGRALGAWFDRVGRVSYIPNLCGFYAEVKTEDGRTLIARFYPDDSTYTSVDPIPLCCTGDLVNDSSTQLVLHSPWVVFWNPVGPTISHKNPEILVSGRPATTVTIPAHDKCEISLSLLLHRSGLAQDYSGTIPVLHFSSAHGRKYRFVLAKVSFYGSDLVVWPARRKRPVHAIREPRTGGLDDAL